MDLVPNRWYAILDPAEVPSGKPVGRRRMGEDLVFWRDAKGRILGAHDRCPHRRAALSLGEVKEGCIVCPFHGFRFDADGTCVEVPAHPDKPISKKMRVPTVDLREAHNLLWMWSGPAAPDPGPIPFFDVEGYSWAGSQLLKEWPVHYTRAVENQLDYAHLAFVHRTTIGRFASVEVDLEVQMEGDHLHFQQKNGQDGGIDFIGPNIWKLNLSPNFFNFLAFVPIDDEHMVYYLRSYQRTVKIPGLDWAYGKVMALANPIVLAQDQRVVVSQDPPISSLENGEVYVLSDKPIIEYLKWRKKLKQAAEADPDSAAT